MIIQGNVITLRKGKLPITGGTMQGLINMNSFALTGLPKPTAKTDAARKQDLDQVAENAQTQNNNVLQVAQSKVSKINAIAVLTIEGWADNTQTVEVSGVTADNSVIVGADPANHIEYVDANIRCTAQGENALTFVCDDVPAVSINANVMILN